METLAPGLGCKIGSLPISYPGLPLGAPYKSTRVWDVVEERFKKRLSLWKRQYLSKGDRLTLVKSTLSSLPTYFIFLFLIPKRVCVRLEKIQRDFLWGGGTLENRPHLVSWKVICAAKKYGGLGIRSLAIFNKALLKKWLWRFANENESLWKQIISRKGIRPPFPALIIWSPWVPTRVSFFGWEAAWSRLLTIDRLKRNGWSIPNRYYLCKNGEETTYRLLLFCEKARMLWLLIFSFFGVQWVMHSSVRRNLLGWHGSFVGKKREKAWRAAPSA
ncbi:putative ribonuclease H protein [Vitis vinifera]|uniref:Putative ribonuclease H protein n=1 Tax=Vitis vinifera TaxID=29760 RepID=A0A438E8M1_VITVI|nr:putative ribonuclease H protein [Vitis vinifera]